jgi:hypothetical protein
VLKLARTSGEIERFGYDHLSRVRRYELSIDGAPYAYDFGYDDLGRHAITRYPEADGMPRFGVRRFYGKASYLERVANLSDDAKTYWEAIDRDAAGRVLTALRGNGVETNVEFDDVFSVPTSITSAKGGTLLQELSYAYDPAGNMKSRYDAQAGQMESFIYDGLDRLISADASDKDSGIHYVVGTTYDSLGNITSKTDVPEGYDYGWSQTAALIYVVDLRRPASRGIVDAMVQDRAAGEPEVYRQDFRNSLMAAYRRDEIVDQTRDLPIELDVHDHGDLYVRALGRRVVA